MTALGYASNKEPFLELAERVPLSVLESVVNSERTVEKILIHRQALLRGNAGLLPSQRPAIENSQLVDCPYVNELETIWETSDSSYVMAFTGGAGRSSG